MATTFHYELNSKPTSAGKYAILLRITQDRKSKRVTTPIYLKHKSDWNPKKECVRPSEPNSAKWNVDLEEFKERYTDKDKELKESGNATAERIVLEVKASEVSSSFLMYAKQRTDDIENAGGYHNWKKYNGFINKLKSYMEKSEITDISFADLTPVFLNKFNSFLHTLRNEIDGISMLHPNTIVVNLNIFKTLVNRAIAEGLIKPEKNPFLNFRYSGVKTIKEKLSAEEIKAIEDLELTEYSLLWNCRNYFLFSYYCAGIRCADLIKLKWCNIVDNGNRICYVMDKNGKKRDLTLIPEAKEILRKYYNAEAKPKDYIFPLLKNNAEYTKFDIKVMPPEIKKKMFNDVSSKNALINKELKKIAKLAGIEKNVSFHISRHSFANKAMLAGTDSRKIQNLLAHSKLQTTETYMGNFNTSENDNALKSIFQASAVKPDTTELLNQLKQLDQDTLKEIITNLKGNL